MTLKLRFIQPIALATLAALSLVFLLNSLSTVQAAPPFPDQRQSAAHAVKWLVETYQNNDGGYTNFSSGANQGSSGVSGTADAILALAIAGYNPAAPYPGKANTPIHWLETHPISLSTISSGEAAKLLLAVSAANQDPHDFAGYDLVISLTNRYTNTGYYANDPLNQSYAMMALKAVSEPIPAKAIEWLTSQQVITTGGWPFLMDTDATAMSIMALVAAGVPTDNVTIVKGLNFLRQSRCR